MFKYLFSINRKYSKECLAYVEINATSPEIIYPSNEQYKRIYEQTGIRVDGDENWVEWIRIN